MRRRAPTVARPAVTTDARRSWRNGASRAARVRTFLTAVATMMALNACGAPNPPGGGTSIGLSISYPAPGQTLAGTAALAAAGFGGQTTELSFELGGTIVDARVDGTAYVDTRTLADGDHVLVAHAVVAGKDVTDEITVRIDNDLVASATVGPDGGALQSSAGSLAILPPGALAGNANVSVQDATQAGILNDFGVDYPALGVTFLGALEVDTGGTAVDLPLTVDLAGWAQAVQPGRQVVMFALGPDGDGDGVGELMFAADAEATATGSVITRPTPVSEVYGFSQPGSLSTQQSASAKPGQIVTITGRGFNPVAPLSNAARYGPASAPSAETLVYATMVEDAAFNPLMQVRLAVPAIGAGSRTLALHNLTTGYRSDAVTVNVGTLGSASPSVWQAFVEQLIAAATTLTTGRTDLAAVANGWLTTLGGAGDGLLAAMAANSGLVSASNLNALEQIVPAGPTDEQRVLVAMHAVVLDAMAASLDTNAATTADAAADLATLLMVTAHTGAAPSAAGSSTGPSTLQSGTPPPCNGTATSPSSGINWGSPVTTGMGDGPPGSCASGGATGGSGPSSAVHLAADLATASMRRGSFRPVAGALVKIARQGTNTALAPFTAMTDATGFFTIPFVPPGEPFTIRAIDPVTLQVAQANGVANGLGITTPVQLVFTTTAQGPGAPTASFVIRPVADARFDGTVTYEFDASGSIDDGAIQEYVWSFGTFTRVVDWTDTVVRGYGRNGTYQIRLTVIDDEGKAGTTTQELVIDDLPHDYWGEPPERVTERGDGTLPDLDTWYGYAVSADGRYVTFSTEATNLHPSDVNGLEDIYLKDMDTGALELISSGASGEGAGSGAAISADGRYVAYEAWSNSGRTYSNFRVLVKDRQTGAVQEVLPEGGQTRASLIALSGDGRTLLFESGTSTTQQVHVMNLDTLAVTRIGLATDGVSYVPIRATAISADGNVVAFTSSSADLVADDTNGLVEDVFVHYLDSQETLRASVAFDGTQGDRGSRAWGQTLSADGRYATFWSDASTFPRATENDASGFEDDVYIKDLATGALTLVSTNAKDVSGDSASILPTISADGRYVAFGSYASNLAPEM
ncbi:MAG: PKD domain-containing protein, partial [Trueperaceae bacterium]